MSKPNTELIHLPYPIYRQCGSVTCPSDKNLKFSVTHYISAGDHQLFSRRYCLTKAKPPSIDPKNARAGSLPTGTM